MTRDIPIVLIAYLAWKFYKKTKIVSLDDIPLDIAFEQAEDAIFEDLEEGKTKGWVRVVSWIWD